VGDVAGQRSVATFLHMLTTIALYAASLSIDQDIDAAQRRYAVVATASANAGALSILVLDDDVTAGDVTVLRRVHNSGDAFLERFIIADGAQTAVDDTAVAGVAYDYQLTRDAGDGQTATGYIIGGIDVDATVPRGHVILAHEASLSSSLGPELSRLVDDLENDAWTVTLLPAPRSAGLTPEGARADAPVAAVLRAEIAAIVEASRSTPAPVTQLFLLGHVAVPRCGTDAFPPDDHAENRGAYGCDAYYADIDGTFTDVNSAPADVRPMHQNVPGDGIFDQDFLPSDIEMGFGRVDFAGLPNAVSALDEVTMLRNYLDRNHTFRSGRAPPVRKALFATDGYVDSVEMCWRSYPALFGAEQTTSVRLADIDAAGQSIPAYIRDNGPVFVFGQNARVPDVGEHINVGAEAVVWSSDQSYFGLWAEEDAPIRALLAAPGLNLAWFWHVGPKLFVGNLAVDEPFGDALRATLLHSDDTPLYPRPARIYDDAAVFRRTYITLLGDPTLHALIVTPPLSVASGASTADGVSLFATVAADGIVIDRRDGTGWRRIGSASAMAGTAAFTDVDAPAGTQMYRVRAVENVVTGSGTVRAASVGLILTVDVEAGVGEGEGEGEPGEGEGEGEGNAGCNGGCAAVGPSWLWLSAALFRRRVRGREQP
jgi:hypothetical protein